MRTIIQRLALPAALAGIVVAGLASSSPVGAVTGRGQQGCPNGQIVGGPNLVQDPNFSRAAQGDITFETELPNRGPGVYPSDEPLVEGGPAGGGFSIQNGDVRYYLDQIVGRPFLGDPTREVPPATTYFYSNPNLTVANEPFFERVTQPGEGYLWKQTVPVVPNTTYNFYGYFDNLLIPDASSNDPVIELRVDDPADGVAAIRAGEPISVAKLPDQWVPIQYAFTTGPAQSQAILEIWDVTGRYVANPTIGSDFAMVGVNLRQCAAAVGVAKAVAEPIRNSNGSYDITYTITVRNYNSDLAPVGNLQVTDELTQTFAAAGSFEVLTLSSSQNVTVNPAYSGRAPNTGLLVGTDALDPGESATITLKVRITVGSGLGGRGPFPNRAHLTANSNGVTVEDDSVPGTIPDLDDDTNPKGPDEDDDTVVDVGTRVALPLVRR